MSFAAKDGILIRECTTIAELSGCVALQERVFALPNIEVSPVRHFVVTMHAGGFTLGAFDGDELVGFVLSIPAFYDDQRAFYSHMTAVAPGYQSKGIGSRLKWAQRERAMKEGVDFIKWTFQPVKAMNAYFNLEKLGATVSQYTPDFYGTDYATAPDQPEDAGLESDRLIAAWHLTDERVVSFSRQESAKERGVPAAKIVTTNDWPAILAGDPEKAKVFQSRLKQDFLKAFEAGLVCAGFERDEKEPKFLLYDKEAL